MGVVSRWQEYARQYGWVGLVAYLGRRVVRPVWEGSVTQLLVMKPPVPTLTAKVPVHVAHLTSAEARQEGLQEKEWASRFSRGDVCFAAWRNNQLVHHSWVSFQNAYIGEVHGWLRLQPGEAYVYDCYTDSSCRGLGIFPAVLSHIGQELAGNGISRIWIAVEEGNRSSLKAIERAGFRSAGEITYRRVGPWTNRTVQTVPDAPAIRIE